MVNALFSSGSTSLPSGNQVDGLPLVLHTNAGELWFRGCCLKWWLSISNTSYNLQSELWSRVLIQLLCTHFDELSYFCAHEASDSFKTAGEVKVCSIVDDENFMKFEILKIFLWLIRELMTPLSSISCLL